MRPVRLSVREGEVFIEWRCEHGWTTWERRIEWLEDMPLNQWPEDRECISCPACLLGEYLSRVHSALATLALAIEHRAH